MTIMENGLFPMKQYKRLVRVMDSGWPGPTPWRDNIFGILNSHVMESKISAYSSLVYACK